MKINIFSLKYRIALIVFLLEVILLTFVLQKTLGFIEQSIDTEFKERQGFFMEMIVFEATEALFSEDYDELQWKIELISKNSEVDVIQVVQPDGVIIGHSDFIKVGSDFSKRSEPSLVKMTQSIEGLGFAEIIFNEALHNQQIYNARKLGFIIAVTGIFIIFIASLLFGYLLTRRLQKLSTAMDLFRQGQKNVGIPMEGNINDEICSLGETFNNMACDIQNYVRDLNKERTLLEDRVAERTKELQSANKALEILATTDRLTQLKNRGFTEEFLKTEVGRFHRRV